MGTNPVTRKCPVCNAEMPGPLAEWPALPFVPKSAKPLIWGVGWEKGTACLRVAVPKVQNPHPIQKNKLTIIGPWSRSLNQR